MHQLLRRATQYQIKLQYFLIQEFLNDGGKYITTFHQIRELIQADQHTLRELIVETSKQSFPIWVNHLVKTIYYRSCNFGKSYTLNCL